MRRHRIGPAVAMTLLALALIAVGGCGGSNSSDTPTAEQSEGLIETSAPAGAGERYDTARKLADCMRQNGAPDFPYPQPDGSFSVDQFGGLDMSALQQIFMESCRQYSLGRH